MKEISRTMSFDSRIEWMEVMCDLMCGGVEDDTETAEGDEEESDEHACDRTKTSV